MDGKTNGGQAANPVTPEHEKSCSTDSWGSVGLTKRELFAAMAMQGFAADPSLGRTAIPQIAACAVKWADALLAALSEPQA